MRIKTFEQLRAGHHVYEVSKTSRGRPDATIKLRVSKMAEKSHHIGLIEYNPPSKKEVYTEGKTGFLRYGGKLLLVPMNESNVTYKDANNKLITVCTTALEAEHYAQIYNKRRNK